MNLFRGAVECPHFAREDHHRGILDNRLWAIRPDASPA